MAPRSLEILMAEKREVKRLLASLGALLEGFLDADAPDEDAAIIEQPHFIPERKKNNGNHRYQDGTRAGR